MERPIIRRSGIYWQYATLRVWDRTGRVFRAGSPGVTHGEKGNARRKGSVDQVKQPSPADAGGIEDHEEIA